MLNYSFPGAYPQQTIHLTFDREWFIDPGYVLIYAFKEDKLLFTHHRERGWELPGGTRRTNECPLSAALRETYEETGAELASLEPIGQYIISHPHQARMVKTIYIAEIEQLNPLPAGFETDNIELLNPPCADSILVDPGFSPLVKDKVYRYSLPVALAARVGLCGVLERTSS